MLPRCMGPSPGRCTSGEYGPQAAAPAPGTAKGIPNAFFLSLAQLCCHQEGPLPLEGSHILYEIGGPFHVTSYR